MAPSIAPTCPIAPPSTFRMLLAAVLAALEKNPPICEAAVDPAVATAPTAVDTPVKAVATPVRMAPKADTAAVPAVDRPAPIERAPTAPASKAVRATPPTLPSTPVKADAAA